MDIYLRGDFVQWQEFQNRRNFERDFIISLIALPRSNQWLFAGSYDSHGSELVDKPWGGGKIFKYRTTVRDQSSTLNGRLVVSFERTGRQSYLCAENWLDALAVTEIRPEKLRIAEFPGYSRTMLTKPHLDIIVRQSVESWRAALGAVAGIYVIADKKTGRLYIGSATATEGLWARWRAYSETGHGGNRDLKQLLEIEGVGYAENFQFGILEIADTNTSLEDILRRESHWKELLLSRQYGYNGN